jgi:putative hydrolase of the HAD superfamily
MDIKVDSDLFFVFDLDDTLFQEIDFLKSAYRYISDKLEPSLRVSIYHEMFDKYQRKENVFQWIMDHYKQDLAGVDTAWLIREYREHIPEITLSKETAGFLQQVKHFHIPAGLITDGRSITQRNKLKALGIEDMFTEIIISEEFGSEKPDEKNYLHFEKKFPCYRFYYFGDNTSKDFITPSRLGWTTVCVKDRGENIHQQIFGSHCVPDYVINSFSELRLTGSNS